MALGWFKKKGGKAAAATTPAKLPSGGSNASKGVSVGKLLREDLIVRPPPNQSKDQIIDFLVHRLCQARGLGDPAPFYAKIVEREQGISTTLDTGLAIPHARMDNLNTIAAILGLIEQGLPDPKQPDLVIRALFLFFSPNRQEAFTQHLHLLRGASALFQPALIDEVLKQPTSADALRVIRAEESAA